MLKKPFIFAALFVLSLNLQACFAAQKSKATFLPPQNKQEQLALTETRQEQTVEAVIQFLNEDMRLPKNITIIMGAEDGPLYDPDDTEILIPYSFIVEMKEYFAQDYSKKDNLTPATAAQDVLLHTLFHEIGHALIDTLNLPVVGKEEDAVDTLATLLLLEFYDDGAEIAISAAEAFAYESDTVDKLDNEDFWDEHSLDIQRYHATLCLIYGAEPNEYKNIANNLTIDRAELCIEDYDKKADSWFRLLEPYLKEVKDDDADE